MHICSGHPHGNFIPYNSIAKRRSGTGRALARDALLFVRCPPWKSRPCPLAPNTPVIRSEPRGFTVIEVLLAVMLLGVGVMALVGTSAMVTRMIGKGQQYTVVSHRARDRFERLRQAATSTAVACASPAFTSGNAVSGGITERWMVPLTGRERRVAVYLTYRTVQGLRADTMSASILCP